MYCLKITWYLQYTNVIQELELQSGLSSTDLPLNLFLAKPIQYCKVKKIKNKNLGFKKKKKSLLCLEMQVKDFFFVTCLSTHLKEVDYDPLKSYLYLVKTKLCQTQSEDYLVICAFFKKNFPVNINCYNSGIFSICLSARTKQSTQQLDVK